MKPGGGTEKEISAPCCFPVLRMALYGIDNFFSNNLSLFYHSPVFFIISLSKALYLRSFDGIYVLYLTHKHTHSYV